MPETHSENDCASKEGGERRQTLAARFVIGLVRSVTACSISYEFLLWDSSLFTHALDR